MANGKKAEDDAAKEKRKRIEKEREEHPHGYCLVARDTEANRRLFPDGPFGKIPMRKSRWECRDDFNI